MSTGERPDGTAATPAADAGHALILVVERDPHVQALERYFLEQAGFTVQFAEDGRKGLELARTLRPHIVICEILVSGMDGISVCRALKADESTRSVIVLVFSILAAEQRALAAGADAYLRKPLGEERLVASVEELLEKHRKSQQSEGQQRGTD